MYIVWSDGSSVKGNDYVAYVIRDYKGEILETYKAQIKGLKNTQEVEYFALLMAYKRINELRIRQYHIYTDSLWVHNSIKNQQPSKKNGFNYYAELVKHFGTIKSDIFVENFFWKSRSFNEAHDLFKKINTYEVFEDFKEVFDIERKSKKRKKTKNNKISVKNSLRKKDRPMFDLEEAKVRISPLSRNMVSNDFYNEMNFPAVGVDSIKKNEKGSFKFRYSALISFYSYYKTDAKNLGELKQILSSIIESSQIVSHSTFLGFEYDGLVFVLDNLENKCILSVTPGKISLPLKFKEVLENVHFL
jgi:ribonuclease HI